jgi:hypothetical protein
MLFIPGTTPLPPPIDPVSIVLDIIGFILRIFGIGGVNLDALTKAVNTTWTNLVFTSTFLYNALRSFWDFARRLLKTILDGLTHIISDILHGHLLQALRDIQKLFHDLHDLFKPILDFIDKLRGWYYKYIYPWVKLVENILSFVRVVLSAFRLLGAKWAAKLDADIAKIQGWISQFNQGVVGTLNSVSTWINFALDPFGIIRKDFFSATTFSQLGTVRRAVGFGGDRYLTASEAANTQGDRAMLGGGAAVLTRNTDGSVTYSDASKRINDGYNAAWKDYGGTTGLP